MSTKIEFFYTHGHHFTATGVNADSIVVEPGVEIVYKTVSDNHDVKTKAKHKVPMHDLKFAVVHYGDENPAFAGLTTIIHGLATKFDVAATLAEASKIVAQEKAEVEAEARAKSRREKEAAKFVERRKARGAERKKLYK